MSRPKPVALGDVRLSVVRGPRSDGRWYWRARRSGARDTLWSGWATREEAIAQAERLVSEGLPAPALQLCADTMAELLATRHAHQRARHDLSPETILSYDKARRHLSALLGDLPPDALDRPRVEGYRNDRLGEGASPRLVALELRVLRIAWTWAVEAGLVPDRPLPSVRVKVQGFVINHRTPRPEEVVRVLDVLRGEHRLAVLLLATTGARISEVAQLRRCDVQPRTGRLTLRGKTGARSFPLPEAVLALLLPRAEQTEAPLLAIEGRHRAEAIRSALRRACRRAGVPRFTPHGLRRMVVDQLIRAGVDVATAASLTGHSVEVMLRHYRKVSDDDRAEAVRKAGLGELDVEPRARVAGGEEEEG